MSTVLLINQVSKNMTLINMYFASNGKKYGGSVLPFKIDSYHSGATNSYTS